MSMRTQQPWQAARGATPCENGARACTHCRSYNRFTDSYLMNCSKPQEWRALSFGLCLFHAVIQVRALSHGRRLSCAVLPVGELPVGPRLPHATVQVPCAGLWAVLPSLLGSLGLWAAPPLQSPHMLWGP